MFMFMFDISLIKLLRFSVCKIVIIVQIMFRRGVMSPGTAKLVCAFLFKYWYGTIGYDVMYDSSMSTLMWAQYQGRPTRNFY